MTLFSPPVACMGGVDIGLILGIMVATGSGMLFFTYWPYRNFMRQLARGKLEGKPLALFMASTVTAILWVFLTLGFCAASFAAPVLAGSVLLLGAVGSLGWVVLLVSWIVTRKPAVESTAAAPKFQVWFQDLLIALFCYGIGLSLLSAVYGMDQGQLDEFVGMALYIFVAGSLGLVIAADLCRFSPHGQNSLKRAAIFVLVFTFFPPILPFAIFGWWRWRRALLAAAR